MTQRDWLAAEFEEYRDHLRAVAYRLLGSASDAEDAVQDTWLRLAGADTSGVDNLGGWLTTVVARVSLNMLRSRRHRQEDPVGDTWTGAAELAARAAAADGPGAAAPASLPADPEDEAVLADSVGLALLVVLDTLTPAERLSFVLHDLFAMPFTEVGAVLDRSPEAARQLASRARRRVRGAAAEGQAGQDPASQHRAGQAADLARQREVAAAFLAAARGGDMAALVALLDEDVTLSADGEATPTGRAAVLQGAARVARGASLAASRAAESRLVLVNGSPGLVWEPHGRPELVLAFMVSPAGLITAIDVIASPDRVRALNLADLPG
ncbi:MAG TPA: sigma-70 family RNA polymerase sigma factor [Streptosporangiaceae bacterium]|jgi:RNA polymerase sigma-70 factor (ECF subfamily)|nr:sigma-70 family RNA polymerase sigma factor [Streptosporangiaceae bacterium]